MHSIERQNEQMAMAGVDHVPETDLSWASAPVDRFGLGDRFCLLVPGGAPHRPAKRWPVAYYARLAEKLVSTGTQPVVLGTEEETPLATTIRGVCGDTIDLTGQTGLADTRPLPAWRSVRWGTTRDPCT